MTTIKLHNTKTRHRDPFEPLDKNNVRMYVCGPTVYDRAHLGNARPVVVFDVLYRLLRHVYGPDHVTYVRNFTDVDDKINARAAESGRSIGEITAETTQWFLDDMAELGALEPDHMPRATQYIPQMVAMIEDLIKKEFAYPAKGHVLFRVRKYQKYGALSGRSLDDMIAGARVEEAPYKEDPMDFVLWKPSTPDLPGWEGPKVDGKPVSWGRPGWHIECSAMSDKLLWDDIKDELSPQARQHPHTFDIHGGGGDLMFPHHENEIAQSCCAHPEGEFARYWLHNEMLQVEGKKMSKSLGNFFTVRDLLDQGVPGEVIRFVFLSTHYRKPMDWTKKKRDEAEKTLNQLAMALLSAARFDRPPSESFEDLPEGMKLTLSNDLDTHGAIVVLEDSAELTLKIERGEVAGGDPEYQAITYLTGLSVLGLYEPLLKRVACMKERQDLLDPIALEMTNCYNLAKQTKDFSQIDAMKASLTNAGVEVKIGKNGVDLSPKPNFDPTKLEALK